MKVGTEIRILNGTNKGRVGKVSDEVPGNARQAGKIPVVVGNRNQIVWVKPESLEEAVEESGKISPVKMDLEIGDICRSAIAYLEEKEEAVSDIGLAIALDISLLRINHALRQLISEGKITETKDGYTCSKQSDSLKVSGDFVEALNSSEDLNGSNQSKSTPMQLMSSEQNLTIESGTGTLETTPPQVEESTSTLLDFHAPIQATPETEQVLTEANQVSGLKPCDVSASENPGLSLWNSLKGYCIEDFEQCLEDSEWLDIAGKIRSFYHLMQLEQRNTEPEFLQLPTLTANKGQTNRPSGLTKCDKIAKDLGIIPNSQLLSAEMMAVISGFPPNWAASLLELNPENNLTDSEADSYSDQQSSPNRLRSHSNESKPLMPTSKPGKHWLDPRKVSIKEGTQSRVCEDVYAVNVATVNKYSEAMRDGLWDFRREPLPVAFVDSAGKFHAGDCHHRVSAAIAAGLDKILFDVREGDLIAAKFHSVQSNTDHGLQLRPKDQRRRIEMLLDTLETIDDVRSQQLLDSITDLTPLEKTNSLKVTGKWTARTCAKYLKLTESGYRTVQNIIVERENTRIMQQFKEEKYVGVNDKDFYWEGRIERQNNMGALIIPLPWTIANNGRMLEPKMVEPQQLIILTTEKIEKIEAALERIEKKNKLSTKPIISVVQEVEKLHEENGIPLEGLPEIERNEGFEVEPEPLVSREVSKQVDSDIFTTFINNLRYFEPEQLLVLQSAIAQRLQTLEIKQSA